MARAPVHRHRLKKYNTKTKLHVSEYLLLLCSFFPKNFFLMFMYNTTGTIHYKIVLYNKNIINNNNGYIVYISNYRHKNLVKTLQKQFINYKNFTTNVLL